MDADDLVPAPWSRAREGEGAIYASVIDIDRFGSLRLNAYPEQVGSLGCLEGTAYCWGGGRGDKSLPGIHLRRRRSRGRALFEDSSGVMARGRERR